MGYLDEMKTVPDVHAFFDDATNTISYVVRDPAGSACAVVDSVMDIDYAAGRITSDHADLLIAFIEENELDLQWIIETHVHADHLSAAPYCKIVWVAKLASVVISKLCRKPSERYLTKALNFNATVRNLMRCSKMATPIKLAQ